MNGRRTPGGHVRLLRAAAVVLRKAGIESARLDAEVLLASVLGVRRFDFVMPGPVRVPKAARREFASLVRARSLHEPVAYLVKAREFLDCTFRVDRRVLVPRPETELLATAAIAWLARRGGAARVLDLGCGSGCLAVSIARAAPAAAVVATDVSPDALEVARANVDALAPGRVRLLQGDLFAAVRGEAPFDLVVSNPPYVAASEVGDVDRAVREHEPESAWLSGDDPLAFHRRILAEGERWFAQGGAIFLELGSGAGELIELARARMPAASVRALADAAGFPRVVAIDRSGPREEA